MAVTLLGDRRSEDPKYSASNGQSETYNSINLSRVKITLKDQNLPISRWEIALP